MTLSANKLTLSPVSCYRRNVVDLRKKTEPVRETCRDCGGDNDRYPVFPDCVACRVRRRVSGAVVEYIAARLLDGDIQADIDMPHEPVGDGEYFELSLEPLRVTGLSAALARVAVLNREGRDGGLDGLYEGMDESRWVLATVHHTPEGAVTGAQQGNPATGLRGGTRAVGGVSCPQEC